MSWFYLEERTTNRTRLIPDLVHHLQRRSVSGPSVIVIDKPTLQLAVLRKEWVRAEYQVERQAASTLGSKRITLGAERDRLEALRFTAKNTDAHIDVALAPPDYVGDLPRNFATLYLLTELTEIQRTSFAAQLKRGGLIVEYAITQ